MVGTPSVASLRSVPEPAYPPKALEETAAGRTAEREFNNEVLAWGRTMKLQVDRLCRWTVTASGGKVAVTCPPAPEGEKVE